MLQLSLKLQEAADGEFSLQVCSKEVCGESRAAAGGLQRVSGGGAVTVSHTHTGLGSNDALDLQKKEAFQMNYIYILKISKTVYVTLGILWFCEMTLHFLGGLCCLYPSNLFKLFQVHLSIAVQVKHLKGNLKVPLGS